MLTARILLIPFSIAVLLITWLPADEAGKVTGIVATLARSVASWGVPFDIAYPVWEFAANVGLFVPLGVLLAHAWQRVPAWVLIAAGSGFSVVIELVQLAIPSRFSTISDVVANTLGTAIGAAAVRILSGARPLADA